MMEASLYSTPQQISHGIMVEEDEELGTPSSSSSANSAAWNDSSSSELTDDATSSASTDRRHSQGSPYQMSSLMAQLPFKRGLSRHYQGKSQSFTSLANVRSLEDLAKPERPYYRKRLQKPCRSYGAGVESQRPHAPVNGCSKAITKRPSSRGAQLPSLLVRRHSFLSGNGRPPVPPHRSGNFSSQTLLFA